MRTQRTVLAQYRDENNAVTFRVERWFVALDHPAESVVKPVLVWEDDNGTERIVLLDSKALEEVITILTTFK